MQRTSWDEYKNIDVCGPKDGNTSPKIKCDWIHHLKFYKHAATLMNTRNAERSDFEFVGIV